MTNRLRRFIAGCDDLDLLYTYPVAGSLVIAVKTVLGLGEWPAGFVVITLAWVVLAGLTLVRGHHRRHLPATLLTASYALAVVTCLVAGQIAWYAGAGYGVAAPLGIAAGLAFLGLAKYLEHRAIRRGRQQRIQRSMDHLTLDYDGGTDEFTSHRSGH